MAGEGFGSFLSVVEGFWVEEGAAADGGGGNGMLVVENGQQAGWVAELVGAK